MNSKSLNFEEYVFSLEKKRNVELPQQLLEVDEEIKKLRKRRAAVSKSIQEVTSEIVNLKSGPRLKSLTDIPSPAWRLIQQHCIREKNCGILHVCLASPTLDKIIKCTSVGNTLRITGEKVFRVLLENSYLDTADVRNCLHSNSKDLQRVVGSTWVYANISVFLGLVVQQEFRSNREITDFAKIANQSKQKWQLFAFKNFTFDAELCKTEEDYKEFWKAALIFIETFGNFLLRVSLLDEFVGHGMKSIHKDLLQQLPRIEYFTAALNCCDDDQSGDHLYSHFSFRSARRFHHHGVNHSLKFLHTTSISCPFLEEVGPLCETWCLEAENLAQISPQLLSPSICRNVKILQLDIPPIPREMGEGWTWSRPHLGFQQFLDADLTNMSNVVTLILKGESQNINWLALLKKFPRVKTIEFAGGNRGTHQEETHVLPPHATFPTVTKLILDIYLGRLPLPLDRIPQLLPSLVQLTIRSFDYPKTELAAQLREGITENGGFKQQNQIIDVYRIYGECGSIVDSNIWGFIQNLSRIIVETVERRKHNEQTKIVGSRKETFARP